MRWPRGRRRSTLRRVPDATTVLVGRRRRLQRCVDTHARGGDEEAVPLAGGAESLPKGGRQRFRLCMRPAAGKLLAPARLGGRLSLSRGSRRRRGRGRWCGRQRRIHVHVVVVVVVVGTTSLAVQEKLSQLRRLAPLALARAALLRGARRAPARRRCGRREAYFHRHNISPACWRALPRAKDVDDEGLPRQEARRHRRLEVPPGPRVLKLYLHARTDASRHDDAHPLGALRPRVSLGGGGAPGAAAAAARASGASAGRSAKDALHGAREMPVSPFRRGATRRPPRR
mmetsp:Transcript_40779/g.132588  ORF Transcript_40779/g.132588 Transcript_40779/m.132588 type:complete len:286 (-) Transcript_40779:8-865(-)